MNKTDIHGLVKTKKQILDNLQTILLSRGEKPELNLLNLTELNEKIWGIHKKKLTVVGARTSNCKSAFAMNIAFDIACQMKNVLFLSLEMPPEDIVERMFCYSAQVNNIDLFKGKYKKDSRIRENFKEFREFVYKLPMLIQDSIGKTWQEIEQIVKMTDTKPDLVVIDHIQEIYGEGRDKKEKIDDYLINLRKLAIENNFALIICSQINRLSQDSENKEPQMHQLKSSGGIEEKADIVILLHYYSKYDATKSENDFKLEVAKNRNGRTGFIELHYEPQFYMFKDRQEHQIKKAQEKIEHGQQEVDWHDQA